MPVPPPPPSHAAPVPPIIPGSVRPTERFGGRNREQSLTYFQPPSFLSPIRESSPTQSYSSSNPTLRRSSAIRRSSNPESISSLHNSKPITSTESPPSYFNLPRTGSPESNHSLALGSEGDDIYMEEAATNGHDHRSSPPTRTDSDASSLSFYYNYDSPLQEPVPMHPVRLLSPHSTNDPAAFFSAPVRGAIYSGRTNQ
jgi:hypothetical protein